MNIDIEKILKFLKKLIPWLKKHWGKIITIVPIYFATTAYMVEKYIAPDIEQNRTEMGEIRNSFNNTNVSLRTLSSEAADLRRDVNYIFRILNNQSRVTNDLTSRLNNNSNNVHNNSAVTPEETPPMENVVDLRTRGTANRPQPQPGVMDHPAWPWNWFD